jgi:4-amino-4-deoxy-L-arabinose transferase-like glycosyltransferase
MIFLLGIVICVCNPAPEFMGFNARFAVFAQEMLRNGPTFFPTTYGTPYPDYPATSTFLCWLASRSVGRVTPVTMVLPTAVASALVLVVIYEIGALHSRRRGLVAVLFGLFTAEFLVASRSVSLDQYTSLVTALSFYLIYSSDRLGRNRRLWLLPGVWLLGFAFRGPVGLVIPAAVTASYFLGTGRLKRTAIVAIAAGCLLGLGFAGLLFAAHFQGGNSFMRQVISAQVTGRLDGRGPGIAYYWYGTLIPYAVSYPIALVIVVRRFRDITRRRTEGDRFLGVLGLWVVVVLLILSIPTAKKMRYIAAITPAISLIASSLVTDVSLPAFLSRTRGGVLAICNGLPGVLLFAVGGLCVFACLREPEWRSYSLAGAGLLIPLLAISWKLDRRWSGLSNRDVYRLAVGVAACLVVDVVVADSIQYSRERTGSFVRQAESLIEETPGVVSFLRVGPDGEDIKFAANLRKPLRLQFIRSVETLTNTPEPRYILTTESVFRSLPAEESRRMRVLAGGRIGHKDFVLLGLDGLG